MLSNQLCRRPFSSLLSPKFAAQPNRSKKTSTDIPRVWLRPYPVPGGKAGGGRRSVEYDPGPRCRQLVTKTYCHIISTARPSIFPAFRSEKTWLILSSFVLWISALTLPSPADIRSGATRRAGQRSSRSNALAWVGVAGRRPYFAHVSRAILHELQWPVFLSRQPGKLLHATLGRCGRVSYPWRCLCSMPLT